MSEIVQAIASADDEIEVVRLLDLASARLGAEAAAFVSFVRDDGSHESFRFLLACDPVWCHEYQRRSWYSQDPWLQYALTHSEPIVAASIPTSGRQYEIGELAKNFGFQSAVVIPAPSASSLSRVGVLCLGCSVPHYFESSGFVALKIASRGLAMELHEWLIARIKRELISNAQLTDEDLELLKFERMGNGTKAIALKLNASTASIDSRFKRLNQKLGVPNRRVAAIMAAEYGLI